MFLRAKSFVERHERRLSALAFAIGFLWDSLTLTRIDRVFDNVVLASYLVIAFASILLLNAEGVQRSARTLARHSRGVALFFLPFAFGGLMSGFLIFYSRSGSFVASAPFLLILVALFFGNEFFRKHYQRFVFQMSVFFVTLFSYSVLIVPVLLGRIGSGVFLLSGAVSLFFFWLALRVLSFPARAEVEKSRPTLYSIVAILFTTFCFLYFNNMIPPIPLSLKEIGVYHAIERTRDGVYELSFEKAPWYALGKQTSSVFHRAGGESVYVWSSVFAPTRLNTEVFHRWAYFDEANGAWVPSTVVKFPISGGRQEGFRGYSVKQGVFPGKWRVDVRTPRGALIGRIVFDVVAGMPEGELVSDVR